MEKTKGIEKLLKDLEQLKRDVNFISDFINSIIAFGFQKIEEELKELERD